MSGESAAERAAQAPILYSGLNVSSSMWDLPVPIFWGQRRLGTNAIWYNDFTRRNANKGKGGKTPDYTYTASVILALCEGIVDEIVNCWQDGSTTNVTTLSALGMTFLDGSPTQPVWSYVEDNYPTQALAYARTALLEAPHTYLGESASIPDNAFECVRANGFSYTPSAPGWINPTTLAVTPAIDCLMSDIITDFLTNPQYGMGFSSGDLADITQYAAYQRAQGLLFSPLLNSQEKATSIIDRWAQLSNAWIYWSGTQLQFAPLGDSAITANGATYTPDLTVEYELGLNDFLGLEEPVKVTRIDPADAFNRTVLDITDRSVGYITNPYEFKDQTLVDQFGLRDNSTIEADEICNPAVGPIVVQLIGKRAAYIRNTYTFKASYRLILCLPGTLLTLTEPNIGLSGVRVRVKTIEEDDDGKLTFTCEEFPGNIGTYNPPIAAPLINPPTTPNTNIEPGNVNTPAIVEPNSAFTGNTPKIIIAASGGANWGGCVVTLSFDGTKYSTLGEITEPATQGVLTGALPGYTGSNPDTTDTLAVDCTQSQASPATVTNADAEALRTLSLVCAQPTISGGVSIVPTNGELLAFGAVATTGSFTANLTWLERGQYGTNPDSAHGIGDQFTLIDISGTVGSTVEFALPAQYIGATLYLKLLSFNVFGNQTQDPSTVVEYQYTPTGAGYGTGASGVPATPTGLGAVEGAGQNQITWGANPGADNVTSYTLYAAPGLSQPFSSAVAIFTGDALAFTQTGLGASEAYTYFLLAANAVGNSAVTAGVNATTAALTPVLLPVSTVADLPAASAGKGFAFVSDSTATVAAGSGNVVVGGGSNGVPVYSDGTSWRII